MAEKVRLPVIGEVPRTALWAGIGITAGIVLWAWWRRTQDTDSGPVVDPATGTSMPGSGYVNPAPAVTRDSNIDTVDTDIRDADDWIRAVVADLSNIGYESTVLARVLGKYVAGQRLTTEEAEIVRTAWGYRGKPPGGPNQINVDPGPDPDPDPDPDPEPEEPEELPQVFGLVLASVGKVSANFQWSSPPKVNRWDVVWARSIDAAGFSGTTLPKMSRRRVSSKTFRLSGLRPSEQYYFAVAGVASDGTVGPFRGINFRTERR